MADFPSRYAMKKESLIGVWIAWNHEHSGSSMQGKDPKRLFNLVGFTGYTVKLQTVDHATIKIMEFFCFKINLLNTLNGAATKRNTRVFAILW